MPTHLLITLLAIMAQAGDVPVPEGHRPYGAPSRGDVLKGWETFIEDVPAPSNCLNIGAPMVQALNPPQREKAVALLTRKRYRRLSEQDAAILLNIERVKGEALAESAFKAALTETRQRKHRSEVERQGSWSMADQQDLEALTARYESGDHRRYRPYLVRAASKFGDGHGGAPWMLGDMCDGDLHLSTLVFSYTIPPSVRVPAVVFLPRPPRRIFSAVTVAW
jgi:hypothetical protein